MAHGHPDYGAAAPTSTVYTLQDLAELAARLGSIVTFDRRGNVMWLDDFEEGIKKWQTMYYGAGYAVEWDAGRARNGSFSCKLTTGIGDGYHVTIYRPFPFPAASNMGLEVSVNEEQSWERFHLVLNLYDGSYLNIAEIKYDDTEHKFYYRDEDDNWQEAGITVDLDLSYLYPVFHTIKVVADFVNHEYKRLIVNNQSVDLSGIKFRRESSTEVPYLVVELKVVCSSVLDPAIAYIDDVIVTQNEP